jgi:hypothetical protein
VEGPIQPVHIQINIFYIFNVECFTQYILTYFTYLTWKVQYSLCHWPKCYHILNWFFVPKRGFTHFNLCEKVLILSYCVMQVSKHGVYVILNISNRVYGVWYNIPFLVLEKPMWLFEEHSCLFYLNHHGLTLEFMQLPTNVI